MIPTFHGLETARRGLNTHQSALHTTGHNISNANTPGYTRQRVGFTTAEPFPGTGINRPNIAGQLGTGVEAGTVERVRESFLDIQYRLENNKVGYYSSLSTALSKMEDIMNEPTDSGLQSVMDKFWNSLQDLANHPENAGAREVVTARGQMVADTLNYYYNSIERIQNDLGNEIDVQVGNINSIISQIDQLNRQIAGIEPHGQLPNDLYDQRDHLVDQLSSLVNVKVSSIIPDNYGKKDAAAVGIYQIEIVQKDGNSYSPPATLINVDRNAGRTAVNELKITDINGKSDPLTGPVAVIQVGDRGVNNFNFSGKLAGLIESYGYTAAGGAAEGKYPDTLQKLDKLAVAFANEFNAIHQEGFDLNGDAGEVFFVFNGSPSAKTLTVNDNIVNDAGKIAAGYTSDPNAVKGSGNNINAGRLADIKSKDFDNFISKDDLPPNMSGNIDDFYASIIGNLGVEAQSANKDMQNSQVLLDSVDFNRQSVNGVSLDEEMTNLITYQHAYNASARMINVIDEMLDKVINGMGIVGR